MDGYTMEARHDPSKFRQEDVRTCTCFSLVEQGAQVDAGQVVVVVAGGGGAVRQGCLQVGGAEGGSLGRSLLMNANFHADFGDHQSFAQAVCPGGKEGRGAGRREGGDTGGVAQRREIFTLPWGEVWRWERQNGYACLDIWHESTWDPTDRRTPQRQNSTRVLVSFAFRTTQAAAAYAPSDEKHLA